MPTPNPHGRIRVTGQLVLEHLGGDAWSAELRPERPELLSPTARVYRVDTDLATLLDAGLVPVEVPRG